MKFMIMLAILGFYLAKEKTLAQALETRLIGAWKFEKVEFIFDVDTENETKDFVEAFIAPMVEESLQIVTMIFDSDGLMRTLYNSDSEKSEEIGSWNLSPDGKQLSFTYDEGTDIHDLLFLDEQKFILVIHEDTHRMLIHMKRSSRL